MLFIKRTHSSNKLKELYGDAIIFNTSWIIFPFSSCVEKYASKIMNMSALYVKLLVQMNYMGKRFLCGHLIMHRGITHFNFPLEHIIRKTSDYQGDYFPVLVGKLPKKEKHLLWNTLAFFQSICQHIDKNFFFILKGIGSVIESSILILFYKLAAALALTRVWLTWFCSSTRAAWDTLFFWWCNGFVAIKCSCMSIALNILFLNLP